MFIETSLCPSWGCSPTYPKGLGTLWGGPQAQLPGHFSAALLLCLPRVTLQPRNEWCISLQMKPRLLATWTLCPASQPFLLCLLCSVPWAGALGVHRDPAYPHCTSREFISLPRNLTSDSRVIYFLPLWSFFTSPVTAQKVFSFRNSGCCQTQCWSSRF